MDGKLPEIYWYVFWIGLVLLSFFMAWLGGRGIHQRAMKALDILKMYAEKGVEPPAAITDQLAQQALGAQKPDSTAPQNARAALIQGFIGFLFMASICSGFYMWLRDGNGPTWATYAFQAGGTFFGFGAFGFLVTAVVTREK